VRPEDGIVLVLIPGGEYVVGCEPPLMVYVDLWEKRFVVATVPRWGPAYEAGLPAPAEIRSVAVDGVDSDVRAAAARLIEAGGEISLELGVMGVPETQMARYRVPGPGDGRILDKNAKEGEGPCQRVRLAPYFIGKFELTQAQWLRWTGENPSERQAAKGGSPDRVHTLDQPVESMSWTEASEQLRHMGLSLPTEAQWEVACRAGTVTPYATGADWRSLEGHANIADIRYARTSTGNEPQTPFDDGFAYSSPVGSYPPNAFGLHDVHGNVWEWCRETQVWPFETPARDGDGLRHDPTATTERRILRGGGYTNGPGHARVGYRWPYKIAGDGDVGIRPARPLDPPTSP
jgi:formylglycine-generating enzyme required for sulfatase activity